MKNILITGASYGLGRSIFTTLFKRYPNSKFYLISRSIKKTSFSNEITKNKNFVYRINSNLANKSNYKKILKIISKVNFDIIVNNAGMISADYKKTFFLNYFSHFFFTYYFLNKTQKKIVIINICSLYIKFINNNFINTPYLDAKGDEERLYAASKLYLATIGNYFGKKFQKNCIVYNINPGFFTSNFGKKIKTFKRKIINFLRNIFGKNPDKIANEIVNLLKKNPNLKKSKILFNKFNPAHKLTNSIDFQNKLFKKSINLYKNI